jgi:hypothetical protein
MRFYSTVLLCLILASAAVSGSMRSPRVIGGSEAQRGSYPFMVALVFDEPGGPFVNQFCGGTLIDPEWVLSAAHCLVAPFGFPDLTPDDFRVIIGIHNLNTDTVYRSVQVAGFYVVPDFNGFSLDGDAVLIRLAERIENVAPIALNTSLANEAVGLRATATGWGLRSANDTGAPALLEVDLPVMHRVLADARLPSIEPLTHRMLAAGGEPGRDTCAGDSGGPLFLSGPAGFVQIGITSFGTNTACGDPEGVGVYTRVSALHEWIDDTRADRFDRGIAAYVRLHAGLPRDPTRAGQTHYARIFQMTGLPVGIEQRMEAWADGFRPRIAVQNPSGQTVATSVRIGQESAEIRFTPRSSGTYRVVLSSEQTFVEGTVDIGFGVQEEDDGMFFDRSLEPGQTIYDSIDEVDFIEDGIYAMIYLLDRLVPGERYHLTATSAPHSGGVPIWLYLLDGEGRILDSRETRDQSHHITFEADPSVTYFAWVENGDLLDYTGDFSISLAGPRRPNLPENLDVTFASWLPLGADWIFGNVVGFFQTSERIWPWVYRPASAWVFLGPSDEEGRWIYIFGRGWEWIPPRRFP